MLRALARWTPTLAILAGIAYFACNALRGENGLIAWAAEKRKIAALGADLAKAKATHADLETRAARLREDTLDPDYLEERARALVGLGRPGDIVVPARAREADGAGKKKPE
jgi:cell division protein FtsB